MTAKLEKASGDEGGPPAIKRVIAGVMQSKTSPASSGLKSLRTSRGDVISKLPTAHVCFSNFITSILFQIFVRREKFHNKTREAVRLVTLLNAIPQDGVERHEERYTLIRPSRRDSLA